MDRYRDLLEKLIKYCNVYAQVYNKELPNGTDIHISFAQIQVLEYLLENEELHQNMSEVAGRLGISNSSFSKLVNKLVGKKLLVKHHTTQNRKDVIIRVSDYGKRIYAQYSKHIMEVHFSKMFAIAEQIPLKEIQKLAQMLDAGLPCGPSDADDPPQLIRID